MAPQSSARGTVCLPGTWPHPETGVLRLERCVTENLQRESGHSKCDLSQIFRSVAAASRSVRGYQHVVVGTVIETTTFSASLGSAHHRAHFQVSAHRIDLCGGSSMWCMPVIVSFCASRVHLGKTIDSLGPSSAFPGALPLVCASCNSCMRLAFVTNCDRSSMCSSQTDQGTTYPACPNAWTNSNRRPLAQEQLWRQPAKMLDPQPVITSLYPLLARRYLSDLCQRAKNQFLERVTSCHQLSNQKVCFCASQNSTCPKEVDHILTFAVSIPAARATCALRAELPLSAESHLPANLTSH